MSTITYHIAILYREYSTEAHYTQFTICTNYIYLDIHIHEYESWIMHRKIWKFSPIKLLTTTMLKTTRKSNAIRINFFFFLQFVTNSNCFFFPRFILFCCHVWKAFFHYHCNTTTTTTITSVIILIYFQFFLLFMFCFVFFCIHISFFFCSWFAEKHIFLFDANFCPAFQIKLNKK